MRSINAVIEPEVTYLKPITAVHPMYFALMRCCPNNRDHTNFTWDSWTATGSCEVHGLHAEEKAIGYQMRCSDCHKEKQNGGETLNHCFSTTNPLFWAGWEDWEIPGA